MITARHGLDLGTAPLVAALASLAAATLITGALMGPGLTTDPWDIPAIVRMPAGSGAPIVLNVEFPVAPPASVEVPSVVPADDLQRPASLRLPEATEPDAARITITTIRHQEQADPAPAEESALAYARGRVAQIVGGSASRARDEVKQRPTRRAPVERAVQAIATHAPDAAAPATETLDDLPVPETRGAAEEALEAFPEGLVPEEVKGGQPDLSTAAGSSSPLV